MANVEKMIAETFLEMAQGLESGSYGKRPKIALTGMGSEHGEENAMEAALMAAKDGVDVYYIGSLEAEGVTTVKVADDEEGHKKMEEMLANGEVDGAVTMHFPFPIGVSTVGRVVTPAKGREMFVANTTGTSSADRIEGMIKNTIYGIIAAKTCGIANPTVGILNVDGARQTEKALKELQENGYDITFAESARADGGCVMRGNDVLQGTPDIMVTDSLTGNIMVKMLSSAATGGSFEATGYGYGPGIGEGYEQLVMIVSRASGAPVIAGAIRYAAQLVRNKVFEVAKAEFAAAKKAGLKKILDARKAAAKPAAAEEDVKEPPKEIVTAQIAGIEVMDLEDAVKALWKINIYAESGMGCTGPIIRVSDANLEKAHIAGAIRYAAQLVRNKVFEVAKAEFAAAKKAGLKKILDARKAAAKPAAAEEDVKEPPKEIVTAQIAGIEVMDLEDAVKALWKINIYAESGMGCTGPIIRVSDANLEKAHEELKKAGYIN